MAKQVKESQTAGLVPFSKDRGNINLKGRPKRIITKLEEQLQGEGIADAIYFVEFDLLKKEIPYIRVAGDYFKIIYTTNQYGFDERKLKPWKKETITDDHGKAFLKEIPIYDDFIILASNVDFKDSVNNSFNLYSKFHHKPI